MLGVSAAPAAWTGHGRAGAGVGSPRLLHALVGAISALRLVNQSQPRFHLNFFRKDHLKSPKSLLHVTSRPKAEALLPARKALGGWGFRLQINTLRKSQPSIFLESSDWRDATSEALRRKSSGNLTSAKRNVSTASSASASIVGPYQPNSGNANLLLTELEKAGVLSEQGGSSPARLGLAVSGGPDSMALAVLTSALQAVRPDLEALCMVVDHRLRPGSDVEAAEVHGWLENTLGLPAKILTCQWPQGPPPVARLQEAARLARYKLMGAEAERNNLAAILTAHHADDQAELFLLRLSRASGIQGLAGMPRVAPWPSAPDSESESLSFGRVHEGLKLVRPLLKLHKHELIQVCKDAGVPWVNDPTNATDKFLRNRIRRFISETDLQNKQQEGTFAKDILEVVELCKEARSLIVDEVEQCIEAFTVARTSDSVQLDVQKVLAAADSQNEITVRALQHLLKVVGGDKDTKPPRRRGVNGLLLQFERYTQGARGTYIIHKCAVSRIKGEKGQVLAAVKPLQRDP